MSHIHKHHDPPVLSNLSSADGEVFATLLRPHFSHSSVFVYRKPLSLMLSSPLWIVSSVRSSLRNLGSLLVCTKPHLNFNSIQRCSITTGALNHSNIINATQGNSCSPHKQSNNNQCWISSKKHLIISVGSNAFQRYTNTLNLHDNVWVK